MVLRKSGRVDSRRFLGVRAKVLREGSRFSFESAFFVSGYFFWYYEIVLCFKLLILFPTAHSLEIVFLDGEFVLHDVMFDLHVMLVL